MALQSDHDDGRMIIKGCVHGTPFTVEVSAAGDLNLDWHLSSKESRAVNWVVHMQVAQTLTILCISHNGCSLYFHICDLSCW